MGEVAVASERFWREFKTDVAATLSDEQRREIERVLRQPEPVGKSELGDIRLSFKWFFVRLVWGPEKRSPERIKQEQAMHPAMQPRNLPMLASLFAGSVAVWYGAVVVGAIAFAYFVS